MPMPSQEVRAKLPPGRRSDFDWQYRICCGPIPSMLLHGMMMAIAVEHPEMTYHDVLKLARSRWGGKGTPPLNPAPRRKRKGA
jgi:hypothetical protein